ncbi:FecR family protein [Pedobacter sp. JY14-1]|uniref:FecR family protein n=1 Tax=Pedobacter sp. JY14-1 TaxID=3034151 RepID=UPI0023E2E3FE|nr:FecR family protein [Pedobacter sp. JY14-1]
MLKRYLAGTCTLAERALVERWYMQFNEDSKDKDISEERLIEMGKEIRNALSLQEAVVGTRRRWLVRTAIAAAVFASLLGTIFFTVYFPAVNRQAARVALDTITPIHSLRHNTLIINGRLQIDLDSAGEGVIADGNGFEVVKLGPGRLMYRRKGKDLGKGERLNHMISTPKGSNQYEIILSDDTKVWLGAASTLILSPIDFALKRSVSMSGEAYFEVFKDRDRPFSVRAGSQHIEVLGTHFNVESYHERQWTRTTLLEGSLRIKSVKSAILRPGEQAESDTHHLMVKKADTDEVTAWRKDEYIFRNEQLSNVMLKLERWYDIDVEYRTPDRAEIILGGSISRRDRLEDVLKVLGLTGNVNFRLEGKKVIVR